MASVHQKFGASGKQSPYYMAKFRGADGRPVMRSTKQRKRSEAQAVADEWERAARKARQGELTRAVLLKTMDEMVERVLGESTLVQSTRAFFQEWSEAPGRKTATISRYRSVLNGFLAYLGEHRSAASIGSVTTTDIERFRNQEIAQGKANSTANLSVKILGAVFNSARRRGIVLVNPCEGVNFLSESESDERQPFTSEQIRDLLDVADEQWQGMILVGLYVGCRLRDAANLTWANIDLANRTLSFRDEKTSHRKRKGRQEIIVYLHDDVVGYLERLVAGDDPLTPLFPSLYGKSSGSHGGLSTAFDRVMKKAGIRPPLGAEKHGKGRQFRALGFHSLRHNLISNLVNVDVAGDVRKEITGHSSDQIHYRYVHLELSTQQRAIEKLPSVTRAG